MLQFSLFSCSSPTTGLVVCYRYESDTPLWCVYNRAECRKTGKTIKDGVRAPRQSRANEKACTSWLADRRQSASSFFTPSPPHYFSISSGRERAFIWPAMLRIWWLISSAPPRPFVIPKCQRDVIIPSCMFGAQLPWICCCKIRTRLLGSNFIATATYYVIKCTTFFCRLCISSRTTF